MDPKYFESQQADEEVVTLIRRHFFAILPAFISAGLIYFCAILAMVFVPIFAPIVVTGFAYNIFVLILSLVFLFNTVFLFNNWVLHYLHVAILTTEHFVEVEQSGLFARKISEMTLDKIQDVTASQKGIFNTLLDIGTVEVQTAGELPNFIFEYIADPNTTAQKIMEIEEVYCKKFGIRTDGINNRSSSNNFINNQTPDLPAEQPVVPQDAPPVIEYPGPKE
jgi:uncharacterized membrane protein YdbT with pleckstrin-like domain